MFKTAILFLSQSKALIISLIWSLYYPHYQEIFTVLTEPFTTLLLISFAYFITKYVHNRKKLAGLYSGVIFGFLVLTKVIFSYFLILLLFILMVFYLFRLNRKLMGQLIYVWIIAFSITLPYQLYTYHLTGKIYYFANSGGSSLYFMTSPYLGEFGEWNNTTFTANCGFSAEVPCNAEKFKKNHSSFFEYLKKLDPISADEEFKKRSLQNIIAHPVKYLKNYINNFSRMLFNIPNSYFYQREQTILRIIPNSFIFVFMVLGIIYSLIKYQRLPNSVLIIIIFVLSYLSIQLLVSSYPRHFNVIVPLILIWLAVLKETWIEGLRNIY
jgi:4-amino-4-deoxy-L-arabinose transferase-like glycosyltransferase